MNSTEANTREMLIFNPSHDDNQAQPLTSTQFWKGFLDFRITGYTKYIQYFGPRLNEYIQILQRFKEPEERPWVESMEIEIEKELAQVDLFKDYRDAFGKMSTEVREFQTKTKKEEENLAKMKNDIKILQEEIRKLEAKQIEEEQKMANRIEKMENYILTMSPKKDEKASLFRKCGKKYDKREENLEEKMSELNQKSEQTFEQYMEHERKKLKTILQGWETLVSTLNSTEHPEDEIDTKDEAPVPGTIINVNIRALVDKYCNNQKRPFHVRNPRNLQELLRTNATCMEYFRDMVQIQQEAPTNNDQSPQSHQATSFSIRQNDHFRDMVQIQQEAPTNNDQSPQSHQATSSSIRQNDHFRDMVQIQQVAPTNIDQWRQNHQATSSSIRQNENVTVGIERTQENPPAVITGDRQNLKTENEHGSSKIIPSAYITVRQSKRVRTENDRSNENQQTSKTQHSQNEKLGTKPGVKEESRVTTRVMAFKAPDSSDEEDCHERKRTIKTPPICRSDSSDDEVFPPTATTAWTLVDAGESDQSSGAYPEDCQDEAISSGNFLDNQEPIAIPPLNLFEIQESRVIPPLNLLDNQESIEVDEQDEFESFKTKVVMTYKKENENEMTVRKGERVRILGRAENSFVLAKKRTRLRKVKVGLIPTWTLGKVV